MRPACLDQTQDQRKPFKSGPDESPSSFSLPVHPSFPHRSIADLESPRGHKAFHFRQCLTQYLAIHVPSFKRHLSLYDQFPVYKQMRVMMKDIPQVHANKRLNTIRANPEKKSKPGEPGTPERFDPVLVRCEIPSDSYTGTSLEGKLNEICDAPDLRLITCNRPSRRPAEGNLFSARANLSNPNSTRIRRMVSTIPSCRRLNTDAYDHIR